MSHVYAHSTFKPLNDVEKGVYVKSPLSQQVEFPEPLSPTGYSGLGLRADSKSAYASSHSLPTPKYAATWVEKKPAYEHKKRHRRIDTATFIAYATRPFLTPHRILSLFAIVCAASYFSRVLPLFFAPATYLESNYNPDIFYRPAASYEAMQMPPPPASANYRLPKDRGNRLLWDSRRQANPKAPPKVLNANPKRKMATQPQALKNAVVNKAAVRPDEMVSNHLKAGHVEFFAAQDQDADAKPSTGHNLAKLDLRVVDGEHAQLEMMERIEAGLADDDADLVLQDENWAEGEETESAAAWLREQDILDELEDAMYTTSNKAYATPVLLADDRRSNPKLIPLPLRGSHRAPSRKDDVSGYMVLKESEKRSSQSLFDESDPAFIETL